MACNDRVDVVDDCCAAFQLLSLHRSLPKEKRNNSKKKTTHTHTNTKMIQLEEENEDRKLLTSDEEQKLVEEVLSDLPPEEKGEREEWNEQVGWHRKENIRKRGGTTTRTLDDNGSENDRNQQQTESRK